MGLYVSLAALSTTAGANAADGAVDAPSTIDNNMNLLASFIAQLRDRYSAFPTNSPVGVSTTTTLTASQKGGAFFFLSNVQATLPALSAVSTGDTFTFIGGSAGGSVKGSGAQTIVNALAVGGNIYSMGVGEKLTLVAGTTGWYAVSGGFGSDSFANSLGGSGYQKWPASNPSAAPLIEQWGQTVLTLNGSAGGAITYPLAFPTAPFSTVACLSDNGVLQSVTLINSQYTNASFGFQVSGGIGATTVRVAWLARGN